MTIAANRAGADGGGYYNCCGATDWLNSVTVSANVADFDRGAPSPGSGGSLLSRGHNLLGSTSLCAIVKRRGDHFNRKPRLRAPAQNGGAVKTMALRSSSPALDAGSDGGEFACPGADARGVARPQGRRCDIGAYERKSRR